jgi:FkbM family methyltransferase
MKKLIMNIWRIVAARPALRKFNQLIFDCSLRGLGILNSENDKTSGEKFFTEVLLSKYINATPVFIDVGANVGTYSTQLLSRFQDSSIWAFEPNPFTFERLKKHVENGNIHTVNMGLSSQDGTLSFYDRKDKNGSSPHGSLYSEVIEEIHSVESVSFSVRATTLDDFLEKHQIKKINLLKIDTEGHELEVLKGAKKAIASGLIDLIHIEFNEMNIVSRVFVCDFVKTLPDYVPYRLLPHGVLMLDNVPLKTELFAYQNLIFVSKKFKPDKSMMPTV